MTSIDVIGYREALFMTSIDVIGTERVNKHLDEPTIGRDKVQNQG